MRIVCTQVEMADLLSVGFHHYEFSDDYDIAEVSEEVDADGNSTGDVGIDLIRKPGRAFKIKAVPE